MKLTFYKNCILTNKYAEVFDVMAKQFYNKTALDNYLDTLEQTEIDLPDVYYTNSGRLNFDLEYVYSIYEYNYMKVEESGITAEKVPYSIKRYCFIDDITIINGEVILSYSEDIWHSYAESLHTRQGLLSRKLILNYVEKGVKYNIKNYRLPIEYQSNKAPKINSFNEDYNSCVIVIEYQTYTEEVQGKVTNRYLGNGAIVYNEINDGVKYNYDIKFDLSQISLFVSDLILSSSTPNTFDDRENFDITNIYILPYDITKLRPDKVFIGSQITNKIKKVGQENVYFKLLPLEYIFGNYNPSYEGQLVSIKHYALPNKSTISGENITFGTFSSQYEVNLTNDEESTVSLSYTINAYHLSLLLGIGNNYEDITKDFILNFPINIDSADVTHLKDMNREYSNLNNIMQIISSSIGAVTSIITGAGLVSMGMPEMGASAILSGTTSSITGISSGALNMEKLNEQMFVSSRPKVILNNLTMTNASIGMCYMTTKDPINYFEVLKAKYNEGYKCAIYVDDILPENNRNEVIQDVETYDIIKFETVNVYGKFPQNICNKLETILTNGVKIWYKAGVN